MPRADVRGWAALVGLPLAGMPVSESHVQRDDMAMGASLATEFTIAFSPTAGERHPRFFNRHRRPGFFLKR